MKLPRHRQAGLGERIPAAELPPSKWSLKGKTKGTGHKEPLASGSATGEGRHSAVGQVFGFKINVSRW